MLLYNGIVSNIIAHELFQYKCSTFLLASSPLYSFIAISIQGATHSGPSCQQVKKISSHITATIMGNLLETSAATPVEVFIIFATNIALALCLYYLAWLYRRYCQPHCGPSKSGIAAGKIRVLFIRLLSSIWLILYPAWGFLSSRFRSIDWKTTFEAMKREVGEIYSILQHFYESRFSRKRRALMAEKEARRRRLEEEEAVRQEEEEKMRALEAFAKDMSGVRVPGGWD